MKQNIIISNFDKSYGLAPVIQNLSFSNFLIYVGTEKTVFRVNRAMVSTKSRVLEDACCRGMKHGQLVLSEYDAKIFSCVLKYIYGNANFADELKRYDELVLLYKYALSLQVEGLVVAMTEILERYTE